MTAPDISAIETPDDSALAALWYGLGVHYAIPIERYHALPGLSCSGMHDLARSPAHYHALHRAPDRPPRAEKPGQLEGALAHCALLEPEEFDRRYAVGPDCRRGTKTWDAWAAGETRTPVKPEQRDTALAQAAAVRALPDVAQLLAVGWPEVSALWTDAEAGVLCRCRPDWVHPVGERGVILMDLKTCASAEPREFAWQIARKGYARQAAHYSDGFAAASGLDVLGFVFAAVESTYPYAASTVMLDDDSLQRGRDECRALIDRYAECVRTDTWPGYSAGVELVSLPAWAFSTPTTD